MNDEITYKIEIAKKTGELDLSGMQIQDINFLSGLNQLINLDLGYNEIVDLSALSGLDQLANLNLGYNKIVDLSILSGLSQLENLNLGFNKIVDLSALCGLSRLTNLELGGNEIVDLTALSHLGQLTSLELGGNRVVDLSPLSSLNQLTSLGLGGNEIVNLTALSGLKQLISLDLWANEIVDLSPISGLNELTSLNLRANEIVDLSALLGLTKLSNLDLGINKIRSIEPLFLLLESSFVPVITVKTDYITVKIGVFLDGNPLESPSLEIAQKGREAIINYFKELRNAAEQASLLEAKVLLVGEGGVGKTSLGIKLNDPDGQLPGKEERTRGISITQLSFPYQDSKLNLNIWDFGGQDIYHATHRFFLTRRSLYVLLTETRRQDDNFDYWIPNIRLFGKDSPILVVKNLFDGHQRHISIGQYLKVDEFNIIGKIIEVNLKSGDGLDQLSIIVRQQAGNLPLVGSPVPSTYVAVKDRLREIAKIKPYVSLDIFLKICEEENIIDESSAMTLLGYLHDLGIVLWYEDIPGLKEKVIVRPEWATNAVYLIIDDEVITAKAGTFNKLDITRLWIDSSYNRLHDELLLLLEAFKLCYKKKTIQEWVIPSLLPLDPPDDFNWNEDHNLIFQFSYTFMPKGMVNQLTAQLDKYIKDDGLVWGAGVVFVDWVDKNNPKNETYHNEAFLKEDRLKRIVEIRVKGVNPSSFMGILISEMEDIHVTYPGIEVARFVPCGCVVCRESLEPDMIPHGKLLERLESGKRDWFCNKGDGFVSIDELLFRVGIEETITKVERLQARVRQRRKSNPIQSNLYRNVSALIAKGDLSDALDLALSETENRLPEIYEELVLHSSMYRTLMKKRRRGVIDDRDYDVRLGRINDGVLEALRDVGN